MRPNPSTILIRGLAVCVVTVTSVLTMPRASSAQDTIDGAVWRFEMTSKKDPARKLVGRYRVSDHVLYQKESPADPDYAKRVGTNYPNGEKTRFEVKDFRAFPEGRKTQVRIKGTARLSIIKFGEWEGLFTDGMGTNWEFKAFRIIE